MNERINIPTPRLYMCRVGQQIKLPKDDRIFTVNAVRDDRYVDLFMGNKLVVTASPCHVVEHV